jgi:hypothetical protein
MDTGFSRFPGSPGFKTRGVRKNKKKAGHNANPKPGGLLAHFLPCDSNKGHIWGHKQKPNLDTIMNYKALAVIVRFRFRHHIIIKYLGHFPAWDFSFLTIRDRRK